MPSVGGHRCGGVCGPKGLIPEKNFQPATRRLCLVAANEKRLEGGDQETQLPLYVLGKIKGTEREVILRLPTLIYEAKINDDLIMLGVASGLFRLIRVSMRYSSSKKAKTFSWRVFGLPSY